MENSSNLGYNTYVLRAIKDVTECSRILVYNSSSFIGNQNYSRLNLYNLEDIFFNLLYNSDTRTYNSKCLVLDKTEDYFEYDCNNTVTPGFNIIIYLTPNDTPAGYTEFLNPQGRISDIDIVRIYLKFKVEIGEISIELNNSLYRVKNRLGSGLMGKELWQFSPSDSIATKISKVKKDQKYTSHLTAFLDANNKSSVFLCDRTLGPENNMVVLDFLKDIDIFGGEEYTNFQIGYYKDDIVLYAWTYIDDGVGYYYRITSLLNQVDYKYTRLSGTEYVDTIGKYNSSEVSKDLLYCSGKYLVFRINYRGTYNIIALFDTSCDKWVDLESTNPIVDPLDKTSKIYELPKPNAIQSYDTAIELIPSLANTYLDLKEFIKTERSLAIIKKTGDWFFIKWGNLCIATCMSYSVVMTQEEYTKSIVLNDNSLLLDYDTYYLLYHGVRKKEYYTEKARSVMSGSSLVDSTELGIKVCRDSDYLKYEDYYKKSEIAIIKKTDVVYNTILNSFRRQPLYTYEVPSNIIGAIGSIIFYINQYNNINYI